MHEPEYWVLHRGGLPSVVVEEDRNSLGGVYVKVTMHTHAPSTCVGATPVHVLSIVKCVDWVHYMAPTLPRPLTACVALLPVKLQLVMSHWRGSKSSWPPMYSVLNAKAPPAVAALLSKPTPKNDADPSSPVMMHAAPPCPRAACGTSAVCR